MIVPSALNVIIVGLMMIIFSFLWRMAASKLAENDSTIGKSMSVIL